MISQETEFNYFLNKIRNESINTRKFMEKFMKIVPKEGGKPVPIKLNKAQEIVYEKIKELQQKGKPIRLIILKARQMGISTLTGAIFSTRTLMEPNTKTAILTHASDSTKSIFQMYQRFMNFIPEEIRPERIRDNVRELTLDNKEGTGLGSSISCMTAATETVGAGQTINRLHLSEFGLWQGDADMMFTTLMATVPNAKNSIVIIESTARGYNHFKRHWDKAVNGESNFTPIFIPWWQYPDYKEEYDGFKLSDEEKRMQKEYNLTYEQVAWYRDTLNSVCNGDLNKMHQEYPSSPEEAFVSTGNTFFDQQIVVERLKQLKEPIFIGEIDYKIDPISRNVTKYDLVKKDMGYLRMYKKIDTTHRYVIGIDTAGEGSDYSVAQVIDAISGEQVATLATDTYNGKIFRYLCYCLGNYFNNAFMIPEVNFDPRFAEDLIDMGYENIYIRERMDTFTQALVQTYGYKTTTITRPYSLDLLKDVVRDAIYLINDRATLTEMLTFIKDKNGKPVAEVGEHDDRVMALSIAYYGRESEQCDRSLITNEEIKPKKELPWWAQDDEKEEDLENVGIYDPFA